MRRIFLVLLAAVFLSGVGCAAKFVQKEWMAIGGSRSDATIKLGYSYDPRLKKPLVNQQQGLDLATQKCQTWGYERAEAFGSFVENCGQGAYDPWAGPYCVRMNVAMEFQCVGKLPPEIENVSRVKSK